jgi:hypothetical protein
MPTEKTVEAKVKILKFIGWNFAPLLPLSVVIQWPFSELQISSPLKVDWISILWAFRKPIVGIAKELLIFSYFSQI